MTAIDAIKKKHQPKKREAKKCSCGSSFFWTDRHHKILHCASCEDPPSLSMVDRAFFLDGTELRDVTAETFGAIAY